MDLIGAAFLESLNAIDLLGELKPDSKFRGLGLIMSLFLHWPDDLNESYGFEGKYFAWRKLVVAYMKKASLSADTGIFGTDKLMEKNDQDGDIGEAKPKRWAFASKVSYARTSHLTIYQKVNGTLTIITAQDIQVEERQDGRAEIRHHEVDERGEGRVCA